MNQITNHYLIPLPESNGFQNFEHLFQCSNGKWFLGTNYVRFDTREITEAEANELLSIPNPPPPPKQEKEEEYKGLQTILDDLKYLFRRRQSLKGKS